MTHGCVETLNGQLIKLVKQKVVRSVEIKIDLMLGFLQKIHLIFIELTSPLKLGWLTPN